MIPTVGISCYTSYNAHVVIIYKYIIIIERLLIHAHMLDTMILFNFTFVGLNIPTKNETRTKTVYENRKISTCTSMFLRFFSENEKPSN